MKYKRIKICFFLATFFIASSISAQTISCDKPEIENAYSIALTTNNNNIHDGILAAGGDYGGEWARDIAINTWNGVSLINPEVALKSLWSVTVDKNKIGHQYWDHIIWTIAALNHYKVTGDVAFLKQAYICSVNSMVILEKDAFDTEFGLFTGPSVFNDGIAGYPEPVFEKDNKSSYVLDYKNAKTIKCLSTNCLYYGAYTSLIEMGQLLKVDKAQLQTYQDKATKLKVNILKNLYSKKENKLYYLIDNTGSVAQYQEGLGVSYAIIFGVLTKDQANKVISNLNISKYGITSIYPDFPRFSADKPGRHNNILWPMVNGFFAQASILAGSKTAFDKELSSLTHLALDKDKGNSQFWEIYNPYTGAPDGGWQTDSHWNSAKRQTWSATAYINMIYYGLVGLRVEANGLLFSPYLPKDIHYIELKDIKYRQSNLDIIIKGNGSTIKSFLVNGKKQANHKIDSTIKGSNKIEIELIK